MNQVPVSAAPHSALPRPRWPLLGLLTAGLLGCAAPPQAAPPSVLVTDDAVRYDGQDHSWSGPAQAEALALSPGDNDLTEQGWISASSGWGPVETNRSNGEREAGDGRTLTLSGRAFARGFGLHALSSLRFDLAGQCTTFAADVGVDDEVGDRGSVVFQVYGDGVRLFDSGVMTGSSAARSVNVSVAGRRELNLVVTDAGDGLSYDHADWASPMLLGCAGDVPGAIRINAGGPAQVVDGVLWLGCTGVDSCGGYVRRGVAYGEADEIQGPVAPANVAVYQTEWTGGETTGVPAGASAFAFEVPVPNGRYTVRLHFAELNKFSPGGRVFDVNLEGGAVELPAFDVFREAGGAGRAIVRSFPVTVTDGLLTLDFTRRTENAKISGIEILPQAGVPAPPAGGPLRWTGGAPALKAVSEAQGAVVGDRLYVFGGFDKNLHTTAKSQAYDVTANRWTEVRKMPEELTHAAVAVDGDTVYVLGGFVGKHPGPQTDHTWKYDAASDTWSAGPSLPGARGGGAAAVLGRELHFFGGVERDLNNPNLYRRDSPEHWVLSLDGSGGWRPAAPLPNPRNHLAGAALNGRIYALGGQHLGDEESGNQSAVQAYDPATDTWTERASLPLPLGHISASTLVWNGRLLVIAGVGQRSREVATVYEYDPAADRWDTLTPLPAARQSPVAGVVGGRLAVTGGSLPSGVFDTTWLGER